MKKLSPLFFFIVVLAISACSKVEKSGTLYFNAKIYTVNEDFDIHEAMFIEDGEVIETGTLEQLKQSYSPKEAINLEGKTVFPGFIDAHSHYFGYALSKQYADLRGSKSMEEVVERLKSHHRNSPSNWVFGRGWDQNLWPEKDYVSNELLNKAFPNTPVYIQRVDGHAAYVNQKAIEIAGITAETEVEGGAILTDKSGNLLGVLVDAATGLLETALAKETQSDSLRQSFLMSAEKDLFEVGLTTVTDAGLELEQIKIIKGLQDSNKLDIRVYAMADPVKENFDYFGENGPIITDQLTVSSFKLYADGALGSRGACLLEPYADKPNETGFLIQSKDSLRKVAEKVFQLNFQLNTHCIGDSANRVMLNIYANLLNEGNDRRWRIEHSQIVHPSDMEIFKTFGIIPSIQTTHSTSDMYWAEDRLGPDRVKYAYAYKSLLNKTGIIINGSDFPVEQINPLLGFASAIQRQDANGFPEGGFNPEEALSRKEALKAMTIWAAYGAFQEENRGSLESGKFADFVVLDSDIMEIPIEDTRNTRVLKTFLGGKLVHNAN